MYRKSTPMTWFVILFVITCLLAIFIPPSQTTLHMLQISGEIYRLLMVTLLIPYGIIWFAAFYGYDQLMKYSRAVAYTGEGKAFRKVAIGLGVLAWGLILQTILSLILSAIGAGHPALHSMQTIISHYFSLAVALIGFLYIEGGAYELVEFVHARRSHAAFRWLIVIGALIGAMFQRLVFVNQRADINPYYLGIYPLIFTIIVPYIFTWMVGVIGTYELMLYSSKVKGLLYRHALQFLANGLCIVILMSIVVQYVTAAFTPVAKVSLGSILAIVYVLLAVQALGFVLVAAGAKRLKKIEEV